MSKKKDALGDEGVYMSPLSPDNGKKAIMENNYGPHKKPHWHDKTDYYFKFESKKLPHWTSLREGRKNGLHRTIWMYPHNISMTQVQGIEFGKTEDHGTVSTGREGKAVVELGLSTVSMTRNRPKMSSPLSTTSAYDFYSSNNQYDDDYSHHPTTYRTSAPRQHQQQQESGPGLGTALAVGAAVGAIGVGLAALFGAFNRPNTRRQ